MAIVTSRNHLTGLVATEGAYPLTLDLLTAADAGDLLARRLGASRVGREPDAVQDIIAACARLPLALTVVAARAASRPGFPLAAFARELREATGTLDPLSGGDLPAMSGRCSRAPTGVRALAADTGQSLEQLSQVHGLADRHEVHRVTAELLGPVLSRAIVDDLGGTLPGRLRHFFLWSYDGKGSAMSRS